MSKAFFSIANALVLHVCRLSLYIYTRGKMGCKMYTRRELKSTIDSCHIGCGIYKSRRKLEVFTLVAVEITDSDSEKFPRQIHVLCEMGAWYICKKNLSALISLRIPRRLIWAETFFFFGTSSAHRPSVPVVRQNQFY